MSALLLPAIPEFQLGTFIDVPIEPSTIPYLVGAFLYLTQVETFEGEPDDVEATVLAFQALIERLSLP